MVTKFIAPTLFEIKKYARENKVSIQKAREALIAPKQAEIVKQTQEERKKTVQLRNQYGKNYRFYASDQLPPNLVKTPAQQKGLTLYRASISIGSTLKSSLASRSQQTFDTRVQEFQVNVEGTIKRKLTPEEVTTLKTTGELPFSTKHELEKKSRFQVEQAKTAQRRFDTQLNFRSKETGKKATKDLQERQKQFKFEGPVTKELKRRGAIGEERVETARAVITGFITEPIPSAVFAISPPGTEFGFECARRFVKGTADTLITGLFLVPGRVITIVVEGVERRVQVTKEMYGASKEYIQTGKFQTFDKPIFREETMRFERAKSKGSFLKGTGKSIFKFSTETTPLQKKKAFDATAVIAKGLIVTSLTSALTSAKSTFTSSQTLKSKVGDVAEFAGQLAGFEFLLGSFSPKTIKAGKAKTAKRLSDAKFKALDLKGKSDLTFTVPSHEKVYTPVSKHGKLVETLPIRKRTPGFDVFPVKTAVKTAKKHKLPFNPLLEAPTGRQTILSRKELGLIPKKAVTKKSAQIKLGQRLRNKPIENIFGTQPSYKPVYHIKKGKEIMGGIQTKLPQYGIKQPLKIQQRLYTQRLKIGGIKAPTKNTFKAQTTLKGFLEKKGSRLLDPSRALEWKPSRLYKIKPKKKFKVPKIFTNKRGQIQAGGILRSTGDTSFVKYKDPLTIQPFKSKISSPILKVGDKPGVPIGRLGIEAGILLIPSISSKSSTRVGNISLTKTSQKSIMEEANDIALAYKDTISSRSLPKAKQKIDTATITKGKSDLTFVTIPIIGGGIPPGPSTPNPPRLELPKPPKKPRTVLDLPKIFIVKKKRKKIGRLPKRKTKYTPSLFAIHKNIRGYKPKIITGVGIRPIPIKI